MELALFDFDGTITRKDSFIDFIKYIHGSRRFYRGAVTLLPWIIGYAVKQVRNTQLKERFLTYYFKGTPVERFNEMGRRYAAERIPAILRDKALERIEWHRSLNHRLVLVSASIDSWLIGWCEQQKMELISTKVESIDGKLTGRLDGTNCHGQEKIRRIRAVIDLKQYNKIYAYGDSSGDKPMLALAQEAFYKPFRNPDKPL
jgi:phosphatidylglycerophosphatase C